MIRRLIGWIAAERSYLTLIAVAVAAAALWAWGSAGYRDRDRLAAWGERVCASAAAELQPTSGPRGAACATAIAGLSRFKADTIAASNQALADALDQHRARSLTDTNAARAAAERAAAAAAAMEKANEDVGPDDRVGADWFRALNGAGGLRAPSR